MRKAALALLFLAGLTSAQDPRPAFEAASVKLDTSGSPHSGTDGSKGQILMTNLTLHRLIERAYQVNPAQVAGPEWLESVRVDVAAKYPPDTKDSEHALMLRTLLEDRFHLVAHSETRELQGYALVLAKGGLKLTPVDAGDNDTQHYGGRIQSLSAKGTSMSQLAGLVSRYLNSTVADRTGINGVFNFDLRWATEDPNGENSADVPTLPFALQETLGVRLQAQKVPAEVIVVDHIERVPTDN